MEHLGIQDMENLRAFLQETSVPCDLSTFASRVMPAIGRLVQGELICHAQIDPMRGKVITQIVHANDQSDVAIDRESFEQYMMGHPVFVHWAMSGDDSSARTSDFVSRREWHRNSLYENFYKALSCEDSLPVALPAPPGLVACFCIERHKNFTDREVQLMNWVKPHLAHAYRNAEMFTLLGQATDEGGPHSVLLDNTGLPVFVPPATRQLIAAYFPGRTVETFQWPPRLTAWVSRELMRFGSDYQLPVAAAPFLVRRDDGSSLTVRLLVGHLTGEQALLVLQERRPQARPRVRPELGLTEREEEVLLAAARGRSSGEIADLLYVSRRTVEKHFENIYSKLGVDNRTAAVAVAFSPDYVT